VLTMTSSTSKVVNPTDGKDISEILAERAVMVKSLLPGACHKPGQTSGRAGCGLRSQIQMKPQQGQVLWTVHIVPGRQQLN